MKNLLFIFFYFPFIYSILNLILQLASNTIYSLNNKKIIFFSLISSLIFSILDVKLNNSFFILIFISIFLFSFSYKFIKNKTRTFYSVLVLLFLHTLYSSFYIYSIEQQLNIKQQFYSNTIKHNIALEECNTTINCYSGEKKINIEDSIHIYDSSLKKGIIDKASFEQIQKYHTLKYKDFMSLVSFIWLIGVLLINSFHIYFRKRNLKLIEDDYKFLHHPIFEQFQFAIIGVATSLIVFHYIPYLFDKDFLRSNITTFSYMFIESTYNGIAFLLLFVILFNQLKKLNILFFFSLGVIVSYFHIFDVIHNYMNQVKLYPNFLVSPEYNEVPSSQYARIIFVNGLFVISLILLFLRNKSFLKFLTLTFVAGYFIFFYIGHTHILSLYSNYKIQEKEHISMLLRNYTKESCEYLRSQCEEIKPNDINFINIEIPLRKVEFPRFKSIEDPKYELVEDFNKFNKSNELYYANLDTSLVRESFKYAFLKESNKVRILIDTNNLSRGSDFYILSYNLFNLLFILIWGFLFIKIKNVHSKLRIV